MITRAFLDHAGSAPVLDEVRAALRELPEGNPSSLHAEGRAARGTLDGARDTAARALDAERASLVFTSGGTESVALALLGAGRRLAGGRRVVTWEHEHQSVLAAVRRLQLEQVPVTILPVTAGGHARVELPADTGLVSIGLANSEVGTLQPLAEVARAARQLGAIVHLDACQGPSWVRVPVELADLVSFSGHKVGAGRGGLLVARPEVPLDPLLVGGPQEWGRRAGREDVAGAVALAVALAVAAERRDAWATAARARSDRLAEAVVAAGGRLTGAAPRLPNYTTAIFPGARGEDLLLRLDLAGVAASSGAACASGSLDPSHVLLAMGASLADASATLRLTVGPATTDAEVAHAVQAVRGLAVHA